LRGVDERQLGEARLYAHYAVQWLARAARAYVSPRPDDSHTNLGWDDAVGGFTTHPLPDGSRLALRIADLMLAILATNGETQPLFLNGHTEADVRAWLGRHLTARGLNAQALDAPSPYEMPAFAVADGARYATGSLGEALAVLSDWYANANLVLGDARQALLARGLDAPPVRCWPHHFDLDTLIYFPAKNPDEVRTLGIGFSPGDEYYDEPYFYVSIHPAPDVAMLGLPAIAHWHTDDFTAAVAPARRIVAAQDQKAQVESHLMAATEAAIKILA
jgi:hypothetical protein